MSQTTNDEKLSETEQEAVRERVKAIMLAEDLSQRQIAHESDIKYGTLTPFLGGKYAGDGSSIAIRLTRWMESRARAAQVRGAAPLPPRYIYTETAQQVSDTLALAQHSPMIVTITGAPGTGKSVPACEYTRSNPNVWKVVAERSISTNRALLSAVSEALGLYARGAPDIMSRAIKQKLMGTRGLIIIDEAQHLDAGMIDQLRTFYDQCEIGIALIGNEAIVGRMEGGKHRAEFAQLRSRVGFRLKIVKPRGSDIKAMLDAWGVQAGDARNHLRAIAAIPGALRNMKMCWLTAVKIARNEGRAELSAEDVKLAWSQLNDVASVGEA